MQLLSAPPKRTNQCLIRAYCDAAGKPSKSKKVVGYWLLGCAGMVFVAVTLGLALYYTVIFYSISQIINTALERINGR